MGSSKVIALIGIINGEQIDIIGSGEAESSGIRRGMVINIDAAVQSLRAAVMAAESVAAQDIEKIVLGIGGDHIESVNLKGVIGIANPKSEITEHEHERVIHSAKSIRMPAERELIHVIPQEYKIDDQDGIRDPIGMSGTRLEAEVHVITGAKTALENLAKVVHRSSYQIEDIVVLPRASAMAVLDPQEPDMGVVVVDIGKSTTSVVVFIEGAIWYTSVLPIGSDHVTNDIAVGLKIHASAAEEVKVSYGCTYESLVNEQEIIEVPSVGGREPRTIAKKALVEIIRPRMEEIFSFIDKELEKSDCRDILTAGIVLTGGGSSMEGMAELAEDFFENMPTRIGYPTGFSGVMNVEEDPAYAAALGLIKVSLAEKVDDEKKGRVKNSDGGADPLKAVMKFFRLFWS